VVDRSLLRTNIDIAPWQPATALWRAIEVEHLLESGSLPGEGRGLDLGCGDGSIMLLVRRAKGSRWTLVGLDPDREELEIALTRQVYDGLLAAEGDAIPENDESFDFVFSNSVLEHVDSLEPSIAEVSRVLKPSGVFLFTVPSEFFHANLGAPGWLGMIATGTRNSEDYHRAIDRRLYHLRYWDLHRWREALAGSGLRVVHSSYYMSRRETKRWAWLSNATAGLLVRLIGGSRARPIDIQRRIGIRRSEAPIWLRVPGRVIVALGTMGLDRRADLVTNGSCLLVVAIKQAP